MQSPAPLKVVRIRAPGAATSTWVPWTTASEGSPFASTAVTDRTWGYPAGKRTAPASSFREVTLPAEATTREPADVAYSTALCRSSTSESVDCGTTMMTAPLSAAQRMPWAVREASGPRPALVASSLESS